MPEGNQEWAMWANEHAFISGVVMIMGGITGTIGFDGYQFAIYSIVAGLIVCLLEYARSCRRKGSTVERRFQSFLQPVMMLGSPITTNYYVRFVLYLVLCIPCAFQLPTVIGGISLLIAALIYFKAALGGESWTTAKAPKRQKTLTDRPPVNPPPRPPPEAVAHKNGADNNGYDPNN
ncbi:putative cytochrome b-245 light chain-like [Apostichopus japonicus]|uniref:Cytochrome b-245 light chain n=1 Tax=Stichopus japonicus TaxID=307972 RepID=A0A2G8KXM3_STIJA|nr:putative cytochrome b-245 light chain-like [Apostichopus japonicus]